MPPPTMPNDPARLRALGRYVVLDTSREPAFDDLAELARSVADCPVAGICLVEGDRVWFKALSGLDLTECPLADTFFTHHLTDKSVLVVPDTTVDGRFSAVPWVTGEPGARFYAGAPLVTLDGYVLGAVFFLDRRPRELDAGRHSSLAALARQAVALLELRRTQLSYHVVIDGAGHVVFHLDTEDRLVSVTPTWARLTSYGVVRSLGRRLVDFVHQGDRAIFEAWLDAMRNDSKPSRLECRLVTLMGGDLPVELFAQPLLDEHRRRVGLVGVIADITERKAREIESQHAQKMESLGRLSAGIAHEINTPIQFVGDNTRFLADSYETMLDLLLTYRRVLDASAGATPWAERQQIVRQAEEAADVDYLAEEVPSAVAQSLDGIERVASIVRAMKTFSHPGRAGLAPADLNEALEATVAVARNQVKCVADLVMDLGALPQVVCNLGDLNQVFLNLIVNAGDAIEEKGEHGEVRVVSRAEGDLVKIEISDTGIGIPEDIRLKIFEPFFTTKEVGRGTGQGLALARAVVQDRHGGSISVDSKLSQGSTFTIRLPVTGPETRETTR